MAAGWSEELGRMRATMRKLTSDLEDLKRRTDSIRRKQAEGKGSQDMGLDSDFVHLVRALRHVVMKVDESVKTAQGALRALSKGEEKVSKPIGIRSYAASSRLLCGEVESFGSFFTSAKSTFRNAPVAMKWWDIDTIYDDLQRNSKKSVSIARDMLKVLGDLPDGELSAAGPQVPDSPAAQPKPPAAESGPPAAQ